MTLPRSPWPDHGRHDYLKGTPVAPTRKVTAATLGAAVATLILWIIPGKEDPAVIGAVTTVSAFALGWLIPEAR